MKVKVNNIELYHERYGSGEPIIFSHGWLDDCSVWSLQAEVFAKAYSVILYDLRGHGRSEKPKGAYSVQTLADDLSSLMHVLKIEKVTLVGFSLGGMLFATVHATESNQGISISIGWSYVKMTMRAHGIRALMRFLGYQFLLKQILAKSRFYKPSSKIVDAFMSRAMQVPKEVAYE